MQEPFDLDYYLDRSSGPPPLFKFRSARNEHHTSVLRDGKLWIPRAFDLNDPFDSKPQQFLLTHDKLRKKAFFEKIWDTGLLSFTGELSGDSRDLLLWSHYADSHRGFCLVIRDEALHGMSRPVKYRSRYPDLDDVNPDSSDFWDEVGFFKARGWAYENERRVLFSGSANTFCSLPTGAVFAVLFGCWGIGPEDPNPQSQKLRHEIANDVLEHSPRCLFFLARVVARKFRVRYENITREFRRSLPSCGVRLGCDQ